MISEVTNEVVMWKLIAGAIGVIIPIIILVIWQTDFPEYADDSI